MALFRFVFSFINIQISFQKNIFSCKYPYENECPSPGSSGNPFVPVFGTKDCNG